MALYPDAQRAQLFNPSPDGEARYTNFPGNFRAADNDYGVVCKQREQRVNSPIRRPGKSCLRHKSFVDLSSTGTLACALL
jgi:hypothetical protein